MRVMVGIKGYGNWRIHLKFIIEIFYNGLSLNLSLCFDGVKGAVIGNFQSSCR